jgi:hypothetical protein
MKPHETLPAIPARWPYVRTSDPDCDVIRVPTPGEMQDALADSESMTGAAKVEHQLGAVLLVAWRSTRYALEADTPRGVYLELHDAGWRTERIATLASAVTDAFKESQTTEDDVQAAEDFTGAIQPSA